MFSEALDIHVNERGASEPTLVRDRALLIEVLDQINR